MDKNSKIYVAGHTGLVGSAITGALKKKGYTNVIGRTFEELDLRRQVETAEFIYENLMIEATVFVIEKKDL